MCSQRVSPTVLRGLPGSKREAVARMVTGTGRSAWPSVRKLVLPGLKDDLEMGCMQSSRDLPQQTTTSRRQQRPSKVDQKDFWGSN